MAFDKLCSEKEFTLQNKKRIVVLSKADELQERERGELPLSETGDIKVVTLSSKRGFGLKELLSLIEKSLYTPPV